MIRPIDTWSIDQITSGQVITNISNVVKELVENSIDAGASVIDIKLINYGKDGIRVQDNGCGINEADFDFLARKHATSKMEQFSDLGHVKTLGFRGEALASLCALSEVTVITSAGGGSGYELKMDRDGSVSEKTKTATPRGTVVMVDHLFHNLPVRRKDFERNHMREYTKVISLIQEYALLSDIRITVEHTTRNRSNLTLRSQGKDMVQRIACIYGFKRTKTLLQVALGSPELKGLNINVNGYISKPAIGMGDSATTCQLIAINNRPSYQPRIVRTLVDVYKQFNITETPFFVFNITMNTDMYDVNISPDKRSLLLHDEGKIIECLKLACLKLFDDLDHPVPRASSDMPLSKKKKTDFLSFASFTSSGSAIEQNSRSIGKEASKSQDDHLENSVNVASESDMSDNNKYDSDNNDGNEDSGGDDDEVFATGNNDNVHNHEEREEGDNDGYNDRPVRSPMTRQPVELPDRNGCHSCSSSDHDSTEYEFSQISAQCNETSAIDIAKDSTNIDGDEAVPTVLNSSAFEIKFEIDSNPLNLSENPTNNEYNRDFSDQHSSSRPSSRGLKTLNTHIHLPVTVDGITDSLRSEANQNYNDDDDNKLKFQNLAIDEEGVEERLQLSIRKDDFDSMEVVGQFNLGFILVVNRKSNHDDLFVIDQHASDEIYNFERLQKNTVLSRQPLISPHQLELSAVEELTIQEHMDIFEKNGFSIGVHEDQPPGHQCFLESVPYSKSTIFDDRDVFELLSKIKEEPTNKDLKCSKLRSMFAMRACRSSIMVGRPLDMNTMRRVVKHLGFLDKPWNCPHGRPTLRHITSLS